MSKIEWHKKKTEYHTKNFPSFSLFTKLFGVFVKLFLTIKTIDTYTSKNEKHP